MIIRTKKYKLPKSTYIKKGLVNLLLAKWWIIPLLAMPMVIAFYFKYNKWGIVAVIVFVGYFLIRFLQIYAVTLLEDNKIIFQPFSYQISSKHIIMQINTKQGMTIAWEQIKSAKQRKKDFTLFISPAQFIHLPKRIFSNSQEIKFLKMLLRRKKLMS